MDDRTDLKHEVVARVSGRMVGEQLHPLDDHVLEPEVVVHLVRFQILAGAERARGLRLSSDVSQGESLGDKLDQEELAAQLSQHVACWHAPN